MKKTMLTILPLGVAFVLTTATVEADLLLHWRLDESAGPNYEEEVSGLSNAAEIVSVIEGQPGLAPDGGTAFGFTNTDPDFSYVDAGTLKSDGTYVAGSDPDYKLLNGNWTIGIWFNWASGANTMLGSDWNSNDGWSTRLIAGQVVHDFAASTSFSGLFPQEGKDYFLAIVRRTTDAADLPGTGEASTDRHAFALYDKAARTWSYFYGTMGTHIRLQGLAIGTFNTDREWVGTLDDPRIYDHAVTQTELDALVWEAITGDCNGDHAVDLSDYANFEACLLGPGGGLGVDCDCFDFESDNDVDLKNYAEFQRSFTGP